MDVELTIRDLERRVAQLELRGSRPKLLRGWRDVEGYTGLKERQLRNYQRNEGLPVMRWGRSVVLVPEMFGTWLIAREPHQAARRSRLRKKIELLRGAP